MLNVVFFFNGHQNSDNHHNTKKSIAIMLSAAHTDAECHN